jgi:hypothetical protein
MPFAPDQPPQSPPPQFYPIHPEFGYLVPAPPLRRKAWLVCKATAFGAMLGAIAVIALSPDRQPVRIKPSRAMEAAAAPVSPEAIAQAALSIAPVAGPELASASAVASPPNTTLPAHSEAAAMPPPPPAKAAPAPKPKKKPVARQKREREPPPAEPEPRSAYASPFANPFAQPRREWSVWQGGWGDRGFGR